MNPGVGHDSEFAASLAERVDAPKRLAIVGSGLAALTAAWIAASRGHRVILYEPGAALGGMQAWRAKVPGQGEHAEAISALASRAQAAGVEIALGAAPSGAHDAVWMSRNYQPGTSHDIDAYEVLAERMPARAAPEFTVVGQDLASAEAALSDHIERTAVGTEPELIAYLFRRCERRTSLWAPVLGGLYYNPQPDLEAL